jgi:hypothetical protein
VIIAVDPGKMSGLFVVNEKTSYSFGTELEAIDCVSEVDRLLEIHRATQGAIHIHCERYTMTSGKHTQQPEALEIIGALRYLAYKTGETFTLQGRSERMRVTREQLAVIDWWVPGKDHVNQAARHAFLGLAQRWPDHSLVQTALGTI